MRNERQAGRAERVRRHRKPLRQEGSNTRQGVRLVTAVTLGLLVAVASASLLRWTMRPVAEHPQEAAPPLSAAAPASLGSALTGAPSVIDGDTLAFGPMRVRLFGIDAPEARQACQYDGRQYACGQLATAELQRLVEGAALTCQPVALDQFRRIVARCSRQDGLDVAEELVARGWALAFRRFSDAYVPAEERARLQRRGIWAGEFMEPESFRSRR
jgi:endonuclease YncB( thermonuclease family)